MKGSKKYASHEYSFAKGAGIEKHKAEAERLRAGSKTYPKKMSDGGSIQAGINQSAAAGGVPHTTVNTMGSVSSGLASAFGKKAKGGEIKAANKEQKAEHKGDSKKDDKIPILASEGEAILPKSVMKSKNAPKKAEKFVKKIKKEDC